MVRILLQQWVKDGWLIPVDTARQSRAYGLTAIYRQRNGNITALFPHLSPKIDSAF